MLTGLYVLTDSRIYPHAQWSDRIKDCIEGGANVIQLREKHLSDAELLPFAMQLKELCQAHGVPLIINDRIELAKKICADGLHIGKKDISLSAARKYLGEDFYIGVSCYRNIYTALRAQQLGADYVAFGRLFSSQTKQDTSYCPLSIIQKAVNSLYIPVCGIGGITPKNVKQVTHSGACLIAVTDSVFNANDPKAVSKTFTGIIRSI
ncbi:MAG: thiamine phosphate synthase [Pseudomonadota bacterium]